MSKSCNLNAIYAKRMDILLLIASFSRKFVAILRKKKRKRKLNLSLGSCPFIKGFKTSFKKSELVLKTHREWILFHQKNYQIEQNTIQTCETGKRKRLIKHSFQAHPHQAKNLKIKPQVLAAWVWKVNNYQLKKINVKILGQFKRQILNLKKDQVIIYRYLRFKMQKSSRNQDSARKEQERQTMWCSLRSSKQKNRYSTLSLSLRILRETGQLIFPI